MILTREQRLALKRVFDRPVDHRPDETYRQFRRRVIIPSYDQCILVRWSGMILGIEPDGYTHS
jgi:hypothetical protein